MTMCRVCGCTERDPCIDEAGQRCELRLYQADDPTGLCSSCKAHGLDVLTRNLTNTAPCPSCASLHIVEMRLRGETLICACLKCRNFWEAMPAEWAGKEPEHCDPCDNCAFRPRSTEQTSPETWRAVLASVDQLSGFYCHKGVPIDLETQDFRFELRADGRPPAGKYRLCAGWIRAANERIRKAYPGLGHEAPADHDRP